MNNWKAKDQRPKAKVRIGRRCTDARRVTSMSFDDGDEQTQINTLYYCKYSKMAKGNVNFAELIPSAHLLRDDEQAILYSS